MTTLHHTDLAASLSETPPRWIAAAEGHRGSLERAARFACVVAWALLGFGCVNLALGYVQWYTLDAPVIATALRLYTIYVLPLVPHTLTAGAALAALGTCARASLWRALALMAFILEATLAGVFWLTK